MNGCTSFDDVFHECTSTTSRTLLQFQGHRSKVKVTRLLYSNCFFCVRDTAATRGCMNVCFDSLQKLIEYPGQRSRSRVFVRFSSA